MCRLCEKPGRAWDSTCAMRQRPNTRLRGKQPDPQVAARRVRARIRGPEEGPVGTGPRERVPGERSDARPREAMHVDGGGCESVETEAGAHVGTENRRRAAIFCETTLRRVQARGRGDTPNSSRAKAEAVAGTPKRDCRTARLRSDAREPSDRGRSKRERSPPPVEGKLRILGPSPPYRISDCLRNPWHPLMKHAFLHSWLSAFFKNSFVPGARG